MSSVYLSPALLIAAHAVASQPWPMPPDAYLMTPAAVDYVAVVEAVSDSRPDHYEVFRSGSWLRQERNVAGSIRFDHFDYATATHIQYFRGANGRYQSLFLDRDRTTDPRYFYSRSRTGRSDTALGEACEIWLITNEAQSIDWFSCETADGIQLWTRAQLQSSGEVFASSRVVELRRGSFERQHAHPPADLLNWRYWLSIASSARPRNRTDYPTRDYDVTFRARPNSGSGMIEATQRRRGEDTVSESRMADGSRSVNGRFGSLSAYYEEAAGGRPRTLSIHAADDAYSANSHYHASDRTEQVLGETCIWWSRVYDEPITTSVGRDSICLTADGIPLRMVAGQWRGPDMIATEVSRRRPSRDMMNLPSRAFDWGAWEMEPDR